MAQDLEPTPPVPQDDGPFNNDPNSAYSPVNLSLQAHFGIGKRCQEKYGPGRPLRVRTRAPENLPERARDLRWHHGQRFVEVLGLSSSRLSKIGSAAALAADPLGHRTDKPPRVERVREVL